MRRASAVIIATIFMLTFRSAAWALPSLVVSLDPGSEYSHKIKFGLITLRTTPQIAMWVETAEGAFVDTIFVTRRSAKADWSGAKGIRRPEALPLWSHARGILAPDGLYMPDTGHPLPDAVSGATPSKAFSKPWTLPASLSPGTYRIKVELNSSFDWNEAYPDKLPKTDPRRSEVNGQPSLLWEAAIEIGGLAGSVELAPVGRGALRGEDGALRPGLEGLTTALSLAADIKAEYRP